MKTLTLTDDQQIANNAFLDFLINDDNYFVIQGAAGTGKSFLISYLLDTFYSRYKAYCLLLQKDIQTFDIFVTATTNKAVSVIEKFLRQDNLQFDVKVMTIFSLLGLKVENNRDTGKTNLTFSQKNSFDFHREHGKRPLIFIDESSFIGEDLQQIIDLILKDQTNSKVVYIGDKYQLAPVGQSVSIMENLICNKVSLNEIVRNKEHIITVGTQFRKTVETGKFNPIKYNDTDVIHVKGDEFKALVHQHYTQNWNPDHCKILAWTNERVQEYNNYIRSYLKLPKNFKEGESVITNEFIKGNKNYTRSIDSIVKITFIDPEIVKFFDVSGHMVELDSTHMAFMPCNYADAKKLLKQLAKEKDWKTYFEIKENWLDLRSTYASSIHKAQGSTYEIVFLDLVDIGKNWNTQDVARLLYVGITRASKQVICYGYLPDRYCY